MVRRDGLGRLAAALLGAALVSLAHAQPPRQPTTEGQARYYVYGAFLTHAVPEIMGQRVALGAELEQRLGLARGADRLQVYDALMAYTDGKRITVRKATTEEVASYKRELKQPVFHVQAGDIALLVEYDLQANTIPFVGQLGATAVPVAAPKPAPVAAAAPPVAVAAPAVAAPAPPPAPKVATPPPPPQPAVKPQARVAPPPPAPVAAPLKPNGPCTVKPVMSEQDLANCRAVGEAKVIQPGPPIVVKPQAVARSEPAPQRRGPCIVKPVMSEEDLANCRVVGEAKAIQPGPPIVVKPQARAEPAPQPQRTGPCEVKPVMTEEDLANCRNAPGGAARVQPGPPPAARAATPSPQPAARKPATPCVIKPVMSEEDLAACGIRN